MFFCHLVIDSLRKTRWTHVLEYLRPVVVRCAQQFVHGSGMQVTATGFLFNLTKAVSTLNFTDLLEQTLGALSDSDGCTHVHICESD